MNPLDIVSIICLIYSTYNGWRQGFATGCFTLIACLGIILFELHFLGTLTNFFHDYIPFRKVEIYIPYVLFATLTLLILIINGVVITLCKYVSHNSSLSFIDSLLGSIIGGIKWTLLLSAFFSFAELINLTIIREAVADSWIGPIIKPLLPLFFTWLSSVWPLLAPFIEDIWIKDKLVIA